MQDNPEFRPMHDEAGRWPVSTDMSGVLALHGIKDNVSVGRNGMLMSEHADFETKAKVCLAFEPPISVCLMAESSSTNPSWSRTGMIVAGGTNVEAYNSDAGSVAVSIDSRLSSPVGLPTQDPLIVAGRNDGGYNEAVITRPNFAGFYWRTLAGEDSRVPEYLENAVSRLGLPVYLIGDGLSGHQAEVIDGKLTGNLGAQVDLTRLSPISHEGLNVDTVILQDELLARGVFAVAKEERRLCASSELGRLFYFFDSSSPKDLLQDGDIVNFYLTNAEFRSSQLYVVSRQSNKLGLTYRIDGELGKGKGGPVVVDDIEHVRDTIRRSKIFNDLLPPRSVMEQYQNVFNISLFTDIADLSIDFLDLSSRCIKVLEDIRTQGSNEHEDDVLQYIKNLNFALLGYAKEAEKHGDFTKQDQAKNLALQLEIGDIDYESLITRRLPNGTSFKLTRSDL